MEEERERERVAGLNAVAVVVECPGSRERWIFMHKAADANRLISHVQCLFPLFASFRYVLAFCGLNSRSCAHSRKNFTGMKFPGSDFIIANLRILYSISLWRILSTLSFD